MSLRLAIQSLGALRRAAAREDWAAVHEGITNVALLLACEAEASVASIMEDVRADYRGAPMRRPQVHALISRRLGVEVADRALEGVSENLGDLTAGELETRLHGIML